MPREKQVEMAARQQGKTMDRLHEQIQRADRLESKLRITTEALEKYADGANWRFGEFDGEDSKSIHSADIAIEALKKISGVA